MSDASFQLFKWLSIGLIQIALPISFLAYFLFFEKDSKTRFFGSVASLIAFGLLTFAFSRISWDDVHIALEQAQNNGAYPSDDVITNYSKKVQDSTKTNPLRANDAFEKRAQKISAQMYAVYNATHDQLGRETLNQADIDLSHIRWEYLNDNFPADQYTGLLDDLENLVTNRMPTAEEEKQWAAKLQTAMQANQYEQHYKPNDAVVAKLHQAAATNPAPDDGIRDFNKGVEALLFAHQFDALETMAVDLRKTDARFLGGDPKLASYYNALGSIKGGGCDCGGYESTSSYEEKDAAIKLWLATKPQSITPRLVMANMLMDYAWQARGHGYSNTITAEQWSMYDDRLSQAEAYIKDMDTAQDPDIFTLSMNLARAATSPRHALDDLYTNAIRTFPRYFFYYGNRANLLQTKWFGLPGELPDYVQSLLRAPGGEDGQIAYSYAADELVGQYGRSDILRITGLEWAPLKEAFSIREKRYGLNNKEWNILLTLAVSAGDRDYAASALDHVGENWDKDIWQDKNKFYVVVAWINAKEK